MPIAINGTGTITGISAGGLPDAIITGAELDGAQTGSAPIYGARAWVNFNGTGTPAIRASGNFSSITDLGTGNYRANFTTSMSDANYVAVMGYSVNGATYAILGVPETPYLIETTGVTMQFPGADCVGCYLAVFR
jgi:hypothetical protein